MATAIVHPNTSEEVISPWQGFKTGLWQKEINVRDFIQQNYQPYEGEGSFLAPATERTRNLWNRLSELFVEERKKGVLDVSTRLAISIAKMKSSWVFKLRPLSNGPSCRAVDSVWL